MYRFRQHLLRGAASAAALCAASWSTHVIADQPTYNFDLPRQPLARSLRGYAEISGQQILFTSDVVDSLEAPAVHGAYTADGALTKILQGSNLTVERSSSGALMIERSAPVQVAQAARKPTPQKPPPGVETVVVTAEKKTEDIQSVPIAVSAFNQKQLTERQVAGGPDLVKEVPNLNFSKTNFSGYNLEIRGIGTQAISVTTDPAVAVAFNGIPFIRNHFFEQEFYDLGDLEVLRGPQGTLYGRNATAGVVNIVSAKPTDTYEIVASADFGNYTNRRLEGMVNLPIVGDKLELRFAGEWTKRKGYSFNELTDQHIDGRDLWSGRATLLFKPTTDFEADLVWEHFQETDDRLRSGKQLCQTDTPPDSVDGVAVPPANDADAQILNGSYLSQGCKLTSLYSSNAFEVPLGFSLPYAQALGIENAVNPNVDPYTGTTQSRNLRVIESALKPNYRAKNDTIELNANYAITPALTLTSQTGYNQDFLWSTEDYNRFNTSPGIFVLPNNLPNATDFGRYVPDPAFPGSVIFCDPQLGCSDRLVGEDLSEEHAWQLNQEFRLASNFSGPFNFSAGANYLHYETEENYYVFINALTIYATTQGQFNSRQSSLDNSNCLRTDPSAQGYQDPEPNRNGDVPTLQCIFIDTNPIGSLNNYGHNYFLSQNPYVLNSYAAFGEMYYQLTNELKLTAGLRWTEDRKHFSDIPSEVLDSGRGYPLVGVVDQQWGRFTGRTTVDWSPKLDFTDQTLVYGSWAHGYKAGGANPPGAVFSSIGQSNVNEPDHPLTFKPEYIDAYELGTKNTLLDGALTLNADVFYYKYKDYQISEIVDRTSINLNFNATVEGAELESTWEPMPGLKFAVAGGYENTRINNGQSAIDLMDRTAGMPGWMVMKPFPTQASNCILPDYVVAALLTEVNDSQARYASQACGVAYNDHLDPVTLYPYQPNPTGIAGIGFQSSGNAGNTTYPIPAGYPGFDPATAPNLGEGFAKNLGGHQLPNAPPFTLSVTAEYTVPVWTDWAATLHSDFYWQGNSFARVFNDRPYDQIHGYTNLNLSLILNSADGWQVMGYLKNVFNTTAITGDFLNSDDSGLTTNVFLTDPRLFGIRVTKDFGEGGEGSYGVPEFLRGLFSDEDHGRPTLWLELGGGADFVTGQGSPFAPAFIANNPNSPVLKNPSPVAAQSPTMSFDEEAKVTYQPADSDWMLQAAVRIGRSSNFRHVDHQTNITFYRWLKYGKPLHLPQYPSFNAHPLSAAKFAKTDLRNKESHAILDFDAGKDVGLGIGGEDIDSTVSFGVRFAQINSKRSVDMRARPDILFGGYQFPAYHITYQTAHFHEYHATGQASRHFNGVGPSLSWKGSIPVFGDLQDGEAAFDLGANGALLFGRQKTHVKHAETGYFKSKVGNDNLPYVTLYHHSAARYARRTVLVPNLGAIAGASYRWSNAKVSLGYQVDFFMGALDSGIDRHKSSTVGFMGPFANVSIGLGE